MKHFFSKKSLTFYLLISLLLGFLLFNFYSCGSVKNISIPFQANIPHPKDTVLWMPYNKILTPAGRLVFFGDSSLENHSLDVAISPDKKIIAVETRYRIVFIDRQTDKILYRLHIPRKFLPNTYSGLKWFTLDNKLMLVWGAKNTLLLAQWKNNKAKLVDYFYFKPDHSRGIHHSIPNESIILKQNGKTFLYTVLDGNDRLVKIDLDQHKIVWQKPTGLAPYGLCYANGKIYVTDWSGVVPSDTAKNTAGIPWENALVLNNGAVADGAVSVMDPQNGQIIKTIRVGLHPNDIIASPDEKFVYVANANDDNVSVISTQTDQVTETISVRLNKKKNPYFGDSPNGLAISSDGKTLFVANGMDNAICVVHLGKKASSTGTGSKSYVKGFIPTAAYPANIAVYNDSILYVADIEAIGARLTVNDTSYKAFRTFHFPKGKNHSTAGDYNTHRMLACVEIIPIPNNKLLKQYTAKVIENNKLQMISMDKLLPRPNVPPRPVPERIGEPSVFKHVIYIIKENRTYDQVLGDIKKGNGDSTLCVFGRKITPNIHKLAETYVLLDNYKASGKCSAEGHVWTDASIVTDYIEKNVRAWLRSYTHVLYDAMAYPKTGFIWDNALAHGKTVRIYGEAAIPIFDRKLQWIDIYNDYIHGRPFKFHNKTTLKTVAKLLCPTYPGYDSHRIPDQLRATAFINELKKYEQMPGDSLPNLIIIALPNDHTALTAPNHPTPQAMVADNDYALGRIVQAITHSKFWKNTVIFVTEDDSQDGWDHVSAYRTVGLVISPYSRTGKVISTDYNQTSMIRTIEQILGLPPMNIEDATATPMFDVFDTIPDYTPYTAIKNQIPLTTMNPPLNKLHGRKKKMAALSQKLMQKGIDADDNDQLLNHILWYSLTNGQKYPNNRIAHDWVKGSDDDD